MVFLGRPGGGGVRDGDSVIAIGSVEQGIATNWQYPIATSMAYPQTPITVPVCLATVQSVKAENQLSHPLGDSIRTRLSHVIGRTSLSSRAVSSLSPSSIQRGGLTVSLIRSMKDNNSSMWTSISFTISLDIEVP